MGVAARVGAVALKQHQTVVEAAQFVHGQIDFLESAHARGHDHGQARAPDLPEQGHVDQVGGAELEQLHVQVHELVQAHGVPGRGEEHESEGLGQILKPGHLLHGQLQGAAMLAVGGPEAVLAGVGGVEAVAGEEGLHMTASGT